jgi:hypothetical protein
MHVLPSNTSPFSGAPYEVELRGDGIYDSMKWSCVVVLVSIIHSPALEGVKACYLIAELRIEDHVPRAAVLVL